MLQKNFLTIKDIKTLNCDENVLSLVGQAQDGSITFSGLSAVLNEVTAEEVTAVVDMEAWMADENIDELTEGSYWMPVNATVEGRDLRQNGVSEVRVHIIEDEN